MIPMPRQSLDIPRLRRWQAKSTAVVDCEQISGPQLVPTVEPAARLPRRPDPSILSDAIPLFLIGRNHDGLWVAREVDGRVGGVFLRKSSALRFAKKRSEPVGCATMLLAERFELDIANNGNPFVTHLGAAKRVVTRLAPRLTALIGKAAATGHTLIARLSRALAEERMHRAAIERELFHGRYKLSSKSDDDLPIVR
jgi:hypothetical protein